LLDRDDSVPLEDHEQRDGGALAVCTDGNDRTKVRTVSGPPAVCSGASTLDSTHPRCSYGAFAETPAERASRYVVGQVGPLPPVTFAERVGARSVARGSIGDREIVLRKHTSRRGRTGSLLAVRADRWLCREWWRSARRPGPPPQRLGVNAGPGQQRRRRRLAAPSPLPGWARSWRWERPELGSAALSSPPGGGCLDRDHASNSPAKPPPPLTRR